jgi:diaminopropionate ammonia-lyase
VANVGARGDAVVTVEPTAADCVRRSLETGTPVTVPGPHRSVMGGLNCGEISRLAWPVLRDGLHAALAVTDEEAIAAMRLFAAAGIAAGATAAAALAGAIAFAQRGALEGRRSVLLLASEGVTDPDGYRRLLSAPS